MLTNNFLLLLISLNNVVYFVIKRSMRFGVDILWASHVIFSFSIVAPFPPSLILQFLPLRLFQLLLVPKVNLNDTGSFMKSANHWGIRSTFLKLASVEWNKLLNPSNLTSFALLTVDNGRTVEAVLITFRVDLINWYGLVKRWHRSGLTFNCLVHVLLLTRKFIALIPLLAHLDRSA